MTDPHDTRTPERRLAAIWFADIPGFTRLSAENEPEALKLLGVLQVAAREIVADHGGNIVKFMGDGVLAEFPSTDPAAEAVLRLQMRLESETASWASGPHKLRAGLHLGDVAVGPDGDIFGDGVNRASRLEELAKPGQLLVSDDVWRQLRRRPDFYFTDGGQHEVRNVPEKMQVYSVKPSEALARSLGTRVTQPRPAGKPTGPTHRPPHRRAIAVGATTGIIAFLSLIVWSAFRPDTVDMRVHDGTLRVAVLPFAVQGDQAEENAYLGMGIAEEMIHALGEMDGVRVVSRRSSFVYDGAESLSTLEIAQKLGVFVLVEGFVRPAGAGSVTIRAAALDADHDTEVGSATWTGLYSDLASGQDQIIRELIEELGAAYAMASAGAPGQPSEDHEIPPAAYEALQRGRHALERGRYREAVTQLEAAADYAPLVGRIKVALAEAVIGVADMMGTGAEQAGERAKALLREASGLEENAEVHAALGGVLARFDWNWTEAEQHYRRALTLDPTTVLRREYAEFLASRGRFAQAHEQIAMSIREEPGSVQGVTARGVVFFREGELAQSRVLLDMALQLDPTDLAARIHLARSQAQLGQYEAADATLAASDAPMARAWRMQLRMAAGAGGRPAALESQLSEVLGRGGDAPYIGAAIQMAAGRPRPMAAAMQRALAVRSPSLMWLATDPIWERARGNARFDELVSRVEGR